MAGKKFDLGSYKTDTSKTQAKHNKYSAFIENETAAESTTPAVKKEDMKKLAAPRSRKAAALVSQLPAEPIAEPIVSKRINMAFSDMNYEFLSTECDRLSVSFVYLINSLIRMTEDKDIESYVSSMKICRSKEHVMRRRGRPAKRINLKFDGELHDRLNRGAMHYNMTMTQYMNTIIEVYAQNRHNINT